VRYNFMNHLKNSPPSLQFSPVSYRISKDPVSGIFSSRSDRHM
jgi:hypothetical protein